MTKVIQLQMSKKDQMELNYQNPLIELEVDWVLGEDYDFDNIEKDKKKILEAVRKDMCIPYGRLTLKDYDVANFRDYQIHIFPR